jgi:hypothetical protein
MSIENHVTSLEISKKLKEIGIKQKAFHSWGKLNGEWKLTFDENCTEIVSAFMLSELLKMLGGTQHEKFRLISENHSRFLTNWNLLFQEENICDLTAKEILYHILDMKITLNEINARIL